MDKKEKKILTANELLSLISKQWARNQDIALIGSVCLNKAADIRKEIENQLKSDGYKLPAHQVPMEKVVEYFNINLKYLKRVSQKE